MKTVLASLALAGVLGASPASAQELVTNGTITAFSRKEGTMSLVPESRSKPLAFANLHKARIFYASGRPATVDNFREGMPVSIYYVRSENRWLVAKILLPDPKRVAYPAHPPSGLTTAERRGSSSRAATDRDITTQPGSKARYDRDITTQPGSTDPSNRDITKRIDRR